MLFCVHSKARALLQMKPFTLHNDLHHLSTSQMLQCQADSYPESRDYSSAVDA